VYLHLGREASGYGAGNFARVKWRRQRTIQRSGCWLGAHRASPEGWDRLRLGQLRSVGLEEVKLTRARERLGAALYLELAVDVVDVALDRAERDNKRIGDHLIGMTLGDQAQDLELAVAQ
jgi:hypothetical protein